MNDYEFQQARKILEELVVDVNKLEKIDTLVGEIRDRVKQLEECLSDIDGFKFDINLMKDLLGVK